MSIRKQYDTDLESLKNSLTEMGRNSADAVENALEALCVADADAAAAIVKGDARINNMERDIEHRCMTLLLRQQPVAAVQIVKYNVDECQDVASQLGVRGIPTLAVYKDGQLQAQQAGAMNSAQFSEFLKNFI